MWFRRISSAPGWLIIWMFLLLISPRTEAASGDISACTSFFSRLRSALQPTSLEKIAGVTLVPAFENEPEIVRRAFVDPTKISALQASWKRRPGSEQAKAAFDAYLELRLKNYPSWVKKKIYEATMNAKIIDGEVLASSSETAERNISLVLPEDLRHTASHYKLLAREIEIAIQNAEVTMGLTQGLGPKHSEFGARRAMWDFKRIFRSENLKECIERVKASRLSDQAKKDEIRDLSRPAETFEQFYESRPVFTDKSVTSKSPEITTSAKTKDPRTLDLDKMPTPVGFTVRHMTAIDNLIVRQILTKEEGERLLQTGNTEKLFEALNSEKIEDDERRKLIQLFGKGDEVKKNSMNSSAIATSQPAETTRNPEAVRQFVEKTRIQLRHRRPDRRAALASRR